jgi:hypothetical protein
MKLKINNKILMERKEQEEYSNIIVLIDDPSPPQVKASYEDPYGLKIFNGICLFLSLYDLVSNVDFALITIGLYAFYVPQSIMIPINLILLFSNDL